ncbi:MAG: hypothetical protein IKQ75_07645 [Bacteroidales bacterium]|nr:hypothetical protein [Bacteroidales bacterium]
MDSLLEYNGEHVIRKTCCKRPNISIILGAGFSVPMGYPMGKDINNVLSHFDFNQTDISMSGRLSRLNISNPQAYQSHCYVEFCHRIIDTYITNRGFFDYEEFFDFIRSNEIFEQTYQDSTKDLISNKNYGQFVFALNNILPQMIECVIKDKDGDIWYDNKPFHLGPVFEYDVFLQVLSRWSDDNTINVHTLNHDMVFESFDKTEYLSDKICDGFAIYGSKYFGELKTNEGRLYNVQLEYYTGKYDKPIRLYKLHGSLDYVMNWKQQNSVMVPDKCIKIRPDIDLTSIKHESTHREKFDEYQGTCHSYFLSGVTSKIKQYNNPFFYNLHKQFHKNLSSSQKLVIIGYGGHDTGINEAIYKNFKHHNKTTIIVDPKPSPNLMLLKNNLEAKLIEKDISKISPSDLL